MPIMKLNVLIMKLYVQPISAFSCSIGSLASCRDPKIILEILNFLLCSEVFLIFTWHWIISLYLFVHRECVYFVSTKCSKSNLCLEILGTESRLCSRACSQFRRPRNCLEMVASEYSLSQKFCIAFLELFLLLLIPNKIPLKKCSL